MFSKKQPMEPDSAIYKTLLESTRAIPWRIDWNTQQFSYIGPQIEELLGWPRDSWVTLKDWADRIHPEDRDRVVNYCSTQSQHGVDHEADYRALRRDGSYLWIRDVVHVVRNKGKVEALIGFMFDIQARKRNEQELERLRNKLEAMSFCDGLTDIANRRRLDEVLAREWAQAQRTHLPVSLILADIDYFKQYNDNYGHLTADVCLKDVAHALSRCASRPRDLVARYGGDEFMLVLPETDAAAARQVAERCHKALCDAEIPHEHSTAGPWLSISVGIATATPGEGEDVESLLGKVDKALYRAKRDGRNRVTA